MQQSSNDVHFDKLFSASTRLLCAIYRTCISSFEHYVLIYFRIFICKVSKSLWNQTKLNFRNGFADNRLYFTFTDFNYRKLRWRIDRANAFNRIRSRVWLYCNQHSWIDGNQKGRRRPCIRIDKYITADWRTNRVSTASYCSQFYRPSYSSSHLIQSENAMMMVTGFGYAFLAAAILAGIGIIIAVLLKQKGKTQDSKAKMDNIL